MLKNERGVSLIKLVAGIVIVMLIVGGSIFLALDEGRSKTNTENTTNEVNTVQDDNTNTDAENTENEENADSETETSDNTNETNE